MKYQDVNPLDPSSALYKKVRSRELVFDLLDFLFNKLFGKDKEGERKESCTCCELNFLFRCLYARISFSFTRGSSLIV